MNENLIVEWAPFELANGVDETWLLAASEALQEDFLARQRGFVRRELLRGGNGQWADLVVWESRQAVDQALKNAAESDVCFEYFRLMAGADHDEPGAGVAFFERAKVYER